MKTALRTLFAICLLATAAYGRQAILVNDIEAIVYDAIITRMEVEALTASALPLLYRQYQNQPTLLEAKVSEVSKDNLDQMIANQLILQDFKKFNLPETLLDKDVEKEIQDIIHARYYGDRMRLTKTLQAEGTSYEQFRKQIRDRMIIGFLRQKNVSSEIIISPHKVETYYLAHRDEFKLEEEIKLRMIVLKVSPDTEAAQTEKLATEILSKLKEGAAFAEMATIYSQGSQRKDGGDWGWWEYSRLNKGLADVAFTLAAGKYSGVLSRSAGDDYWIVLYEGEQPTVGRHYVVDSKTKKESMAEEQHFDSTASMTNLPPPTEFYLMLVEDKHPAHFKSLADVRDEIEKTLLLEERARLEKEWIERLKKKTFVRHF